MIIKNPLIIKKAKLQAKTAIPTTSSQTITADSGYDGLSEVDVQAVNSSIDSNIIPINIKKDVTILGVTGTLESGGQDMLQARIDSNNNASYLFYNYKGSTVSYISNLDTSNVTSMTAMFMNCESIRTIPQLDTSSVTATMGSMFANCKYLRTIPQLNTSNVTNMYDMFSSCNNLITIPLLDMVSVTAGTGNMFGSCYKLTNLTLKNVKVTLTIGSGSTWGHLLTVDSLLNTIKELWDNTSNALGGTRKLTMGTANTAKLASVYVKLVTITDEMRTADPYIDNKKPFEVCESTDEGAMTIDSYFALKNWTYA